MIFPKAPEALYGRDYIDWLATVPPLFPIAVQTDIIRQLSDSPRITALELMRGTNRGAKLPYLTRTSYLFRMATNHLENNHETDAARIVRAGPMFGALNELENNRGIVESTWVPNLYEERDRPRKRIYYLSEEIGGIVLPFRPPNTPSNPE